MSLAKILLLMGSGLIILGLLLSFAPQLFAWFGRLPGDIRIEEENRFIFFPITSMLLISLVLSLLINWLMRK
ncbi:MAG: DUF2905 domain-containing protein [Methylococcaceae bacterium]|nr:DUF2905 domain-containing protein [Methylococcaceae bacterium]